MFGLELTFSKVATAYVSPESIALLRSVVASFLIATFMMLSRARARQWAATGLGKIGDDGAVEPLIKALSDEDEAVRGHVASALGDIGSRRSVDALIHALRDEDRRVRSSAALALGRIGDDRAIGPLTRLLEEDEMVVRGPAAYAIKMIEKSSTRAQRGS